MHRRLVPLLFAVAFLALSTLPSSSSAIICPVSARAAAPCCPPPPAASDVTPQCCTTPCCPTTCCQGASSDIEPACPVRQLTISSSPDPSTAGQPVTISGRLFGASSGTTVSLWQKLPGQTSFMRVAQATTNSAGDYKVVRGVGMVQMNTTWYATAPNATSTTWLQRVSALIRLAATPARARTGQTVTFSGRVLPTHRGERILLQKRTSKGWRTIAAGTIGLGSKFALHHKFVQRGVAVLRAVLGADARNARSVSTPVRVAVRAPLPPMVG